MEVRFAPTRGIKAAISNPPLCAISGHKPRSFDHTICDREQAGREAETEYLGGREVYDELELGRLQDRQIRGPFALEDAAHIHANLAKCVYIIRSIAHQTACFGERGNGIDRGNDMTQRQRGELQATLKKQRARSDQQCFSPLLRNACKSSIDLAIGARFKDFDLPSLGQSHSLCVSREWGLSQVVRIDENGKARGV